MPIDQHLLLAFGASYKAFDKREIIFTEGSKPFYFYQIISGKVKLFNINDAGKEYTQGQYEKDDIFGEPPLILDAPYPCTAVSMDKSIVLRIVKPQLEQLLQQHPDSFAHLLEAMAKKVYHNTILAHEIIGAPPMMRIRCFLNEYKRERKECDKRVEIPYTRQQIANFTGLRVETVIRALSKMKDQDILEIVNKKVLY